MTYEERLAALQLGKLYEAEGNKEAAEKEYDKIINSKDFSPERIEEEQEVVYQALYRKLVMNSNHRGKVLQLAPMMMEFFHHKKEYEEELFFTIGRVYFEVGENAPALDMLERLLRTYPHGKYTHEACYIVGQIYHKHLDKPKQAIYYYMECLKNPPVDLSVIGISLADCYTAIGEFDKAREMMEKYVGISSIEVVEKLKERG